MKIKRKVQFTEDEKNWMDTLAVNYIIAQSDGFQLGYAQALSDFTENIIDYWNGSDDKPQQSILDALVDLGVELGKRKWIAEKNIEVAKENGYDDCYNWEYREKDKPFSRNVKLFTKDFEEEEDSAGIHQHNGQD